MIREATENDAAQIAAIYNYYIQNTVVTFEEEPVSPAMMAQRIFDTKNKLPFLVYENDHEILGYAYANEWKSRCAYKFSVETTVYLKVDAVGKGIGTQIYEKLISRLRKLNYHAVIGGISLPNPASKRLHEKLGYEKIAHFREVGFKFNQWIDVGYWELILT